MCEYSAVRRKKRSSTSAISFRRRSSGSFSSAALLMMKASVDMPSAGFMWYLATSQSFIDSAPIAAPQCAPSTTPVDSAWYSSGPWMVVGEAPAPAR